MRKHIALRNIVEMHFEVSKACNLSCKYCFSYQGDNIAVPLMPLNVACNFIDLVFENSASEKIEIIFHGGEPLMQSNNWFFNVIEYAYRKATEFDKKNRILMQSNITLIDNDDLNMIKEFHVMVGTSIDGPPNINDIMRGKGALVLKNINKLRDIGCFGGVLCVINEHNCYKIEEVLNFFEEQGIPNVNLIVGYAVGRGISLSPLNSKAILSAYRGSYEYLRKTKGLRVLEDNIAAKLSRFVSPPCVDDLRDILVCSNPFCGGGIHTVFCDTQGDLYPCGCGISNSQTILGNIFDFNSDEYISRVMNIHDKDEKYHDVCKKCEAAQICRCGCSVYSPIDPRTTEAECQANKLFMQFLKSQKLSEIQTISKNLEQNKRWN